MARMSFVFLNPNARESNLRACEIGLKAGPVPLRYMLRIRHIQYPPKLGDIPQNLGISTDSTRWNMRHRASVQGLAEVA